MHDLCRPVLTTSSCSGGSVSFKWTVPEDRFRWPQSLMFQTEAFIEALRVGCP